MKMKGSLGSSAPVSGKGLSVNLVRETIETVDTSLGFHGLVSLVRARLGIVRSGLRIAPGLYAVGNPGADSPVFASANYVVSFDKLRTSLQGIDAYILVLDTRGINVWCAAGKGTFGTRELVARIASSGLAGVVMHRRIIVPQLGAPGIAAHEVRQASGFEVIYGPIRARDIERFLENGYRADPAMRRVSFTMKDRLALTGVELVQNLKYALLVIPLFLVLGFLRDQRILLSHVLETLPFFASVVGGAFVVPALLPWIPGKAFSIKGWIVGIAVAVAASLAFGGGVLTWISNLLALPAISAFISLNFTGATTYTSLSGVLKEMKAAVPVIASSFAIGMIAKIVAFLRLGGIT
jgi:hypothetical protein